jgi:hypothetical protein
MLTNAECVGENKKKKNDQDCSPGTCVRGARTSRGQKEKAKERECWRDGVRPIFLIALEA